MEKHVTSLELSKRLEALGVKQESHYAWTDIDEYGDQIAWVLIQDGDGGGEWENNGHYVCAFLASEITDYIYRHTKKDFWIYHNAGLYMVQDGQHSKEFEHESIAECFGLWLEYLIQNKMI